MEPLQGFNKDACGAKLLPMTVSAYPVSVLSLIEYMTLLPVSYMIQAARDITAVLKKVAAVLAGWINYRTLLYLYCKFSVATV